MHGGGQRGLLRRAERGPGAFVDEDEIGLCKRGRVERERALGQRDALGQCHAAVELDAGVDGQRRRY